MAYLTCNLYIFNYSRRIINDVTAKGQRRGRYNNIKYKLKHFVDIYHISHVYIRTTSIFTYVRMSHVYFISLFTVNDNLQTFLKY